MLGAALRGGRGWSLEESPQNLAVDYLRRRFSGLIGIWAFGSRVTGGARPDSDWDLAILVPTYVDPVDRWDAANDLADLLQADVDLVDLRTAGTMLQYQIVSTGERWWRRDAAADLYEAVILAEWVALNEARMSLVRDILREGHVYGR